MTRHRGVAPRAETPEERALGHGLHPRVGVIHAPQRFPNLAVGQSRLHAQDPLPHRRKELLHGQQVGVLGLEAQAIEPGTGHDEAVAEAFVELAQSRVHVAADGLDDEVGSPGEQQGAPPQARGGDARPPRKLVEPAARSRQQDVARVFARRIGRQGEPAGQLGGHVLEAVCELGDLPFHERLAPLRFALALAQVRLDHRAQVVDVVAESVVEIVDGRLDVARHGDVDEEERAGVTRAQHGFDVRRADDGLGGSR